jgi:hypothetical protein
LSLRHRQDRTNLLASGTTGTLLNREEVERARAHAPKVPGALTFADLRAQAEAAETRGDRSTAAKLWGWLGEIPGDGAAAGERLKALNGSGETSPCSVPQSGFRPMPN